eukprot:797633_1
MSKPLLFDLYDADAWSLSATKSIITLVGSIDTIQLIYLNNTGYNKGVHHFGIKSRHYPYSEDSWIGIVSQRNKQWTRNADELLQLVNGDRVPDPNDKRYFLFPIGFSMEDGVFGFNEGEMIMIQLDCDNGKVACYMDMDCDESFLELEIE